MTVCPFCSEGLPRRHQPAGSVELFGCGKCRNPFILEWEGPSLTSRALDGTQDIRVLAPEGSIGAALLDAVDKSIERLPVLPEISQRVLGLVSSPDAGMQDLADVLQEEQVLALAVMRQANSAIYGGIQEITDLAAACARLGMKAIANCVQVVATNNLFITGDKRIRVLMERLQRHSVAVAVCAGELAKLSAQPRSETVFLAGLIHDIGKVAIFDIIAGGYSGPLGQLRESPDLFRQVLDSFHPLIGLHVAQAWGLPPELAAVVYAHHEPTLCPDDNWTLTSHLVCLADVIANAEGHGLLTTQDEEVFLVNHPSARYLNLTDIKLAGLRVDLEDILNAYMGSAKG
jgi:putative nucleotidyltransferase with HDIG domain